MAESQERRFSVIRMMRHPLALFIPVLVIAILMQALGVEGSIAFLLGASFTAIWIGVASRDPRDA